ncbi:MAG: acyl-CoA thioesterase [Bdellovibrionales bacterium]
MTSLKFKVAFDEADGEGIVFFGNYFRLAHRAFEAYIPHLGISWEEWFRNPEFGVPLRHVEADYLGPLKPGDDFEAHVRVGDMGNSSVQFHYEFYKEGHLVARLMTAHVFVSRPDMRKISLPQTLVERLRAGQS